MNIEKIIQEFREKFTYVSPAGKSMLGTHQKDVEQFLLAKLEEQKKEFAAMVEELRNRNFSSEDLETCWNHALSTVLRKLNEGGK